MPRPSGKQRDDLARFGRLVARQAALKLIEQRNTGRITATDYDLLETILQGIPNIDELLDGFDAQVDITRALNELEPMPRLLVRAASLIPERASLFRSWRSRVEAAIRYLKADPR